MSKLKLNIQEFPTLHGKKLLSVTKTFISAVVKTVTGEHALFKMLDPNCVDNYSGAFYHIGLDVYPCGDKQERVYPNGTEYKACSKIKGEKVASILNALMTIPFQLVLSQTAFHKNKGLYVLTNRLQLFQKLLRIKMITTK